MNEAYKQLQGIVDCEVEHTIIDRLAAEKSKLVARLEAVNAAIDALNSHPEVAEVLTLVGKAISRIYS